MTKKEKEKESNGIPRLIGSFILGVMVCFKKN